MVDLWDGVIQGGPLLEVSFLLQTYRDAPLSRFQLVDNFFQKLNSLRISHEIVADELEVRFQQFHDGYPSDENDPEAPFVHHIIVPFRFFFPESRKANLYIDELGPQNFLVSFTFYGSKFDAPEWDQRSVLKKDVKKFVRLLQELFILFRFPLGCVAYESDCTDLFPYEYDGQVWEDPLQELDATTIYELITPEFQVVLWHGRILLCQD